MPPPFSIPPPLPPQNFSGLTDEELRAMEGHERANVEARIKCLRNIQVLLDAAVMEMQQYSSVVSQLDLTSRRSAAASASTSGSNTTPTASAVNDETSVKETKVESRPLATAETGARSKVKAEDKKESQESDKEQDEVRKRRLERFTNNNAD